MTAVTAAPIGKEDKWDPRLLGLEPDVDRNTDTSTGLSDRKTRTQRTCGQSHGPVEFARRIGQSDLSVIAQRPDHEEAIPVGGVGETHRCDHPSERGIAL